MRLGDLLIRARRVTESDVERALDRVKTVGGRLGESLVALGAIDRPTLDSFLHRIPAEPKDLAATGIDESELMTLLVKLVYSHRLQNVRQYMHAIKLPYHIVVELVRMAVDRQLLQSLGTRNSENPVDMRYSLTERGRQWAMDALEHLRYTGPAPVPIGDFTDQVNLQKLSSETINLDSIRVAMGDLEMDEGVLEQLGPAFNSGRALLLYGPSGNGKTTVALHFATVFQDVIYIPYAVEIEGQIMRVFDASVHEEVEPTNSADALGTSLVRQDRFDARWVPCRRPFVITGGELTLEMLDLRYEAAGHFYEAPLHVKALGGCLLIDDFGRQLVSPKSLLNRWIVPLESRFDFLKLHTGKTIRIPFDEMVIFSTNLDPEELMDPAFLRRLPYKIEVGAPTPDRFRRIFAQECVRNGMELTDDIFNSVVHKIRHEKGLKLAAFQPRFIVEQVAAFCRFLGEPPHFEARTIIYAVDNLRARRVGEPVR